MKKNITIVIALIIILTGGIYFYKNKKVAGDLPVVKKDLPSISNQTTEVVKKDLPPTPNQSSISTDVLEDQKTYTNTKYGFKIKYYKDFTVDEDGSDESLVAFSKPGAIEGVGFKIYFLKELSEGNAVLSITDLEKEVKKRWKDYNNAKISVVKIGGFEVVKVENIPGYVEDGSEAFVLLDNGAGVLLFSPGNHNVDSIQKIN